MDYFNIWRDVWNLQKKYAEPRGDESYWVALVQEANNIIKKHNGCQFVQDLAAAVIDEQDRRWRQNANT